MILIMNNKTIGSMGEKLAQEYLKKFGFTILETNYRYSKISEIDIIAVKKDVLHFVEVKTRSSSNFGTPFEAITKAKLTSIYNCSKYYLSQSKKHYIKTQIDAISIILNHETEPQIEFIENISLN